MVRASSAIWLLGLAVLLAGGCAPTCDPGEVCVLIGTGELGFNGDGLPGPETALASPTAVREAPDGRPLVVDFSNMRVRVLDADGVVSTLVGEGIHAYSEPGVAALDSPLENPVDARWGPDGLLYIAPLHEGRIVRVSEDGLIERVAGTGENLETSGDGGPALDATMGYPAGIAWGSDGTLYVSDNTNHRVRAVAPDGSIDTVLGTGERGFDLDGVGRAVRLSYPMQLEVVDDKLLVADSGNDRVGELDLASGLFRTLVGTGEEGAAGDGGPAALASLSQPTGLAADEDGWLWIGDLGNGVVRQVAPDGTISTVVGADPEGTDPDGETFPALAAPLRRPAGLALTASGELLIADRGSHRVLLWRRER